MKTSRGAILFGVLIVVLLFVGGESFLAYRQGHTYYQTIFSTKANWWILVSALITASIPIVYFLFSKPFKLRTFWIFIAVCAGLFGVIHGSLKGGTAGLGWFIMIINTLLLFALGCYTFLGFLALGSWVERKVLRFKQIRWQELLLSLGVGTCAFLIIIQIFLGIGILWGWMSLLLFIGLGVMIYFERGRLKEYGTIVLGIFTELKRKVQARDPWMIVMMVLVVLSLVYVFYGLQNSFIPYSTAWDANHAYMYVPKIIAENAGLLRGNTVGGAMPEFWHLFITFFFSLSGSLGNGILGLSTHTVAVAMNFWSALLVLVLGIALMFQISDLLVKKEEKSQFAFAGISLGRSVLLLWLTSGMGAFLVMVDNKTDLGVMALSLLALLAGMIFLGIFQQEKEKRAEIFKYLLIAGLFFGFASLAKVTAFVDLALFGIFLVGFWISPWSALGVGCIVAGLLRYMNILTASFMLSETNAKRLLIIGCIFVLIGVGVAVIKKRKLLASLGYLVVLGIGFLAPLLLFKTPWQIATQVQNGNFSVQQTVRRLLAQHPLEAKVTKVLVAQAEAEDGEGDLISLEEQNLIDEDFLASLLEIAPEPPAANYLTQQLSAEQCLGIGAMYDEEMLKEGLQEVRGGGLVEDFGRYIGFGWKTFKADNSMYVFAKLLRPGRNTNCYGLNTDAKVLCKHGDAVDTFDVKVLRNVYETQISNYDSQAAILLKEALDAFDEAGGDENAFYNPQEFRDYIVALRQYYQTHSIRSDEGGLSLPYRYIVPLNMVFNRSLQNLSSYYTDLGFVRIVLFIILIVSLPYALVKRDTMLINLSLTTLLGWGIWWIIGSAILWYGTVLISWTAVTLLAFGYRLWVESDKRTAKHVGLTLVIVILLAGITQLLVNFMRISSQGAMGAFVWYKGNVGKETIITDALEVKSTLRYGYGAKDVFNLQFPQYNPIIHQLKDRNDEDGVVVAGTYIQYFLDNQWNLNMDGLLMDFWVRASDGDLCKTYRRHKNDHIKYLIVDPNIGTVGMGEGNETLFHRFFAKLNAVNGTIEEDGTLTTLVKMYKLGYLRLMSTNNIGAYYAFRIDDATMRSVYGPSLSDEELVLLRAKLIGLRYFPAEADGLFNKIGTLLIQRVLAGEGAEDLASLLGVEIDVAKVSRLHAAIGQGDLSEVKTLSQGERMVLIQLYNISQSFSTNNTDRGQQGVQSLLMNSITSSSQVMALELL